MLYVIFYILYFYYFFIFIFSISISIINYILYIYIIVKYSFSIYNMIVDENLIFIILITVFIVFLINKQPKLIAIIILSIIIYYIYKRQFTNPKEFFNFIQTKVKEAFEPCSSSNMSYCSDDISNSNMSFLPDIIRSNNLDNINNSSKVILKLEDFLIDKRLQLGEEQITVDEMISKIPILLDYKLYLERLMKFVLALKTDDTIQKEFLANKLRYKMSKVFYSAYNSVTNKSYLINIYNELLYAEREFNDTLNIFILLGLDEYNNNKMMEYQKEFKTMNEKLNEYISEKVNDITPNDYNITTTFLPRKGEPIGISELDNNMDISYLDFDN